MLSPWHACYHDAFGLALLPSISRGRPQCCPAGLFQKGLSSLREHQNSRGHLLISCHIFTRYKILSLFLQLIASQVSEAVTHLLPACRWKCDLQTEANICLLGQMIHGEACYSVTGSSACFCLLFRTLLWKWPQPSQLQIWIRMNQTTSPLRVWVDKDCVLPGSMTCSWVNP